MPSAWDVLQERSSDAASVVIAAPYIKADALNRVLDVVRVGASLVCVTRWTPTDILVGASDLKCRSIVVERGGTFRLHTRLHAKFYRCDSSVLVGSANLTASGLSYSGIGNLEILCEPEASFDHAAFEAELLQGSREVSDSEFARWAALEAVLPPLDVPGRATVNGLGEDWKPSTRDPEHVWLLHRGLPSRIISDDERRLAQRDLDILAVPRGMPREAFNMWVCAQLLASPFIESVMSMENVEAPDAWAQLAKMWDMSESEAARCLETAHNWLSAFLAPEMLHGEEPAR